MNESTRPVDDVSALKPSLFKSRMENSFERSGSASPAGKSSFHGQSSSQQSWRGDAVLLKKSYTQSSSMIQQQQLKKLSSQRDIMTHSQSSFHAAANRARSNERNHQGDSVQSSSRSINLSSKSIDLSGHHAGQQTVLQSPDLSQEHIRRDSSGQLRRTMTVSERSLGSKLSGVGGNSIGGAAFLETSQFKKYMKNIEKKEEKDLNEVWEQEVQWKPTIIQSSIDSIPFSETNLENPKAIEVLVQILKKSCEKRTSREIAFVRMCLKKVKFFKDLEDTLPEDLIHLLFKQSTIEKCSQFQRLYKAGDFGRKYYVILHGSVFILLPEAIPSELNRGGVQDGKDNDIQEQPQQPYYSAKMLSNFIDQQLKAQGSPKHAANANSEEARQAIIEKVVGSLNQGFSIKKTLEKGEGFGEIALRTEGIRTASIVCRENTVFLSITASTYREVLEAHHDHLDREKLLFFHNISIFQKARASYIHQIMMQMQTRNCKPGEVIFDVGQKSTHLYFVRYGEVELQYLEDVKEEGKGSYSIQTIPERLMKQKSNTGVQEKTELHKKSMKNKKKRSLIILGPSQYFGDYEIFKKSRRVLRAVSYSNSEIFFIERKDFFGNVTQNNMMKPIYNFFKEREIWYSEMLAKIKTTEEKITYQARLTKSSKIQSLSSLMPLTSAGPATSSSTTSLSAIAAAATGGASPIPNFDMHQMAMSTLRQPQSSQQTPLQSHSQQQQRLNQYQHNRKPSIEVKEGYFPSQSSQLNQSKSYSDLQLNKITPFSPNSEGRIPVFTSQNSLSLQQQHQHSQSGHRTSQVKLIGNNLRSFDFSDQSQLQYAKPSKLIPLLHNHNNTSTTTAAVAAAATTQSLMSPTYSKTPTHDAMISARTFDVTTSSNTMSTEPSEHIMPFTHMSSHQLHSQQQAIQMSQQQQMQSQHQMQYLLQSSNSLNSARKQSSTSASMSKLQTASATSGAANNNSSSTMALGYSTPFSPTAEIPSPLSKRIPTTGMSTSQYSRASTYLQTAGESLSPTMALANASRIKLTSLLQPATASANSSSNLNLHLQSTLQLQLQQAQHIQLSNNGSSSKKQFQSVLAMPPASLQTPSTTKHTQQSMQYLEDAMDKYEGRNGYGELQHTSPNSNNNNTSAGGGGTKEDQLGFIKRQIEHEQSMKGKLRLPPKFKHRYYDKSTGRYKLPLLTQENLGIVNQLIQKRVFFNTEDSLAEATLFEQSKSPQSQQQYRILTERGMHVATHRGSLIQTSSSVAAAQQLQQSSSVKLMHHRNSAMMIESTPTSSTTSMIVSPKSHRLNFANTFKQGKLNRMKFNEADVKKPTLTFV